MEISILLLLIVPLTVAAPLKPKLRTQSESLTSEASVQTSVLQRSKVAQEEHVPQLRIIPFHSEGKQQDLDVLKNRFILKLRPRRTPQHGCQLGTCQFHNLANTLHQISKTSGKDKSKNTHDPQGYGK